MKTFNGSFPKNAGKIAVWQVQSGKIARLYLRSGYFQERRFTAGDDTCINNAADAPGRG